MSWSSRGEVELRYTSCQVEDVVPTCAAARPDLVSAGLPVASPAPESDRGVAERTRFAANPVKPHPERDSDRAATVWFRQSTREGRHAGTREAPARAK